MCKCTNQHFPITFCISELSLNNTFSCYQLESYINISLIMSSEFSLNINKKKKKKSGKLKSRLET